MKKIIMLILITSSFIACGKKDTVELTSRDEKEKLVKQIVAGDTNSKKKYDVIIQKLKIQMKEGKKEAQTELEEWEAKLSTEKSLGLDKFKKVQL